MKVFFKNKRTDYPKKLGDCQLAWYQQGQICIMRKKTIPAFQKQNMNIIQVNRVTRSIWTQLSDLFKRDLSIYALRYKLSWPSLRKRGVSAYSIMLMITHALIRRFGLDTAQTENCSLLLIKMLEKYNIVQLIALKILKPVPKAYQLNQPLIRQDAENNGSLTERNPEKYRVFMESRSKTESNNCLKWLELQKTVP